MVSESAITQLLSPVAHSRRAAPRIFLRSDYCAQTKLENREHTIRETIRDEYAALVRDLSLRLIDANTIIQQRHSEMHQVELHPAVCGPIVCDAV